MATGVSSVTNARRTRNAVEKGMGSSARRQEGAVVAKAGEIKMRWVTQTGEAKLLRYVTSAFDNF
jgi:hypothetical protein